MSQRSRDYNLKQSQSTLVREIQPGCLPDKVHSTSFDLSRHSPVAVTQSDIGGTRKGLRAVNGQLLNAQDEESRRLAGEIHDINQRLSLLSIDLEQLRRLRIPVDISLCLEELHVQAREISSDLQQLSYRLHPAMLEHLGLAIAVRRLCEDFSIAGNLKVELSHSGSFAQLENDVALCIFRTLQEALRNCGKHSEVTTARVTLKNLGREIRLSIFDKGCGFDKKSDAMEHRLGFTSIRERLRLVGGSMEIRSHPARGILIKVSIPLRNQT